MPATKEDLLEQYDLLKSEYIRLLNDKDVFINWGKPQLEALYMTKIGVYSLEKLKQQLHIKALKRKIELVQSAISNGHDFNVSEIELQVAGELAHAELKIMGEVTKLEKAKHILTHLNSPERSAELRKLFKEMAKQLHPDANPDLTPEQMDIWHLVKDAYESGDVEKLKALQVVYEKEINGLKAGLATLTDDELTLRNTALTEGIRLLHEEIKSIRSEFPFTIEQQIKDEEWVTEQVTGLKKELEKMKEYEKELQQHYLELIN
ncbi:MAG: hypothetical protein WKF88_05525 [Ferruginibacter sp.]